MLAKALSHHYRIQRDQVRGKLSGMGDRSFQSWSPKKHLVGSPTFGGWEFFLVTVSLRPVALSFVFPLVRFLRKCEESVDVAGELAGALASVEVGAISEIAVEHLEPFGKVAVDWRQARSHTRRMPAG